jgi:hypothetical protein
MKWFNLFARRRSPLRLPRKQIEPADRSSRLTVARANETRNREWNPQIVGSILQPIKPSGAHLKKNALTLVILSLLCGAAYAADKSGLPTSPVIPAIAAPHTNVIINAITVTPGNPKPNEEIMFTITSSGSGNCKLMVVTKYPGGEAKADGFINTMPFGEGKFFAPAGTAKVSVKTTVPGVYSAIASGNKWLDPKCGGQAEVRFVVVEAAASPAPAVGKPAVNKPTVPCKTPGKPGVGKDCAL